MKRINQKKGSDSQWPCLTCDGGWWDIIYVG